MITTFIKLDALYTALAIMTQTSDFCSKNDLSILVISLIVGIALMFGYCIFSRPWCYYDERKWIMPLTFTFLIILFPMYLLADNLQPLDCAFGRDSFAFNQTQGAIGCDEAGSSILRLCFAMVTFIAVSVLSLILLCCRYSPRGEDLMDFRVDNDAPGSGKLTFIVAR